MSIGPRFERSVLAEFALRERRARCSQEAHGPPAGALIAAGLTRHELAAVEDRVDAARPSGEILTALGLLLASGPWA